MKKEEGVLKLKLINNPDILKSISLHKKRPKLVVGFAAETKHLTQNAIKKIKQKKCDFIIANNVSKSKEVFGGNMNEVAIINTKGIILKLKKMDKKKLAKKIVKEVIVPSLN
jgi:phosphopantothenoylcysteine decarboxylase/phosphopantothenate--cysteine ligase